MAPLIQLILLFSTTGLLTGELLSGTVYMNGGKPTFVSGKLDRNGAAYGTYNNSLLTNGWGVLDVSTGTQKVEGFELMFAAGYIEGVFTAGQMWAHYQNVEPFFLKGKESAVKEKLQKFFFDQDQWMRSMISKYAKQDPFWMHAGYILSQYDGLYAGYIKAAKKDWDQDIFIVQLLNGVGDLLDLIHVVHPEGRPDFSKMSHKELRQYILENSHCSGLIKVLGGYENIFMSHSSWFTYSATSRIFKYYNFDVNDPNTAARKIAFSSYPGFLESLDDFYMLGSGLVVIQTTNNVFNNSLYDTVTPQSLFAWQRMRLTNMLANTGKEWTQYFSRYNSGTYNNQYMVLDLKQIELKKNIGDGALWVVEQIPTLVEGGDQSAILRAGYWPSYNVPFYEEVYNKSGYPAVVKKFGLDNSYQLAPRAKIFRRDQDDVTDLESMRHIMRYNDYQHDPYSQGNPCDTICCRGDLNSDNPSPMGCYDTKVTDYNMALKLQAFAINGPTLGKDLKPFSWTGKFENYPHTGLPKSYNFPWVFMSPSL